MRLRRRRGNPHRGLDLQKTLTVEESAHVRYDLRSRFQNVYQHLRTPVYRAPPINEPKVLIGVVSR